MTGRRSSLSRPRPRAAGLSEPELRLTYRLVARLLDYPDADLIAALPELRRSLEHLPDPVAVPLEPFLNRLDATAALDLASDYVETFDHRRRCCLYLTYYAYGDTRKRGMALLNFKAAYRRAGLDLTVDELPDHLPLVLEFAGTTDLATGQRLLCDHRAGLELLRLALTDADSPYAMCLDALSATLPPLAGADREAVARLAAEGPPGEEVGLEPFAPPDYMGARR